ncbi:MAG: helix-turn-helix domain-containing protein [Pyrinomonadaceae bacterium MAG19_C2-C3]|nr:helix-turn-helix domain-containing protein [Pyrinomonadaceae bacterium MAG19_C2-C3]
MEHKSRKILTFVQHAEFTKRFIAACGSSEPAEIARNLGIPYQSAKNYLQGRLPATEVLLTIVEKTGVSLDWLITGRGPKYPNGIVAPHPISSKLTLFFIEEGKGKRTRVPVKGEISAGKATDVIQFLDTDDGDFIVLNSAIAAEYKELFALRVNGDSMEDEGIYDNSYVICYPRERETRNGDAVVALIDNSDATLKLFYEDPVTKVIELRPSNPKYAPKQYSSERIQVQAVVIGIYQES